MVVCHTDEAPSALEYWEVQVGHGGNRAQGQMSSWMAEITDKVRKVTFTARVCFLNFPR